MVTIPFFSAERWRMLHFSIWQLTLIFTCKVLHTVNRIKLSSSKSQRYSKVVKAAVPVTFTFITKEDCKRTSINSKHNLGVTKGVSALWTTQETPEKARWEQVSPWPHLSGKALCRNLSSATDLYSWETTSSELKTMLKAIRLGEQSDGRANRGGS